MPEEQEFQRVDVRDYLQVILRAKFIIVITAVLVVAGAFFWSYLQPNVYEAQAQILVVPRSTTDAFGLGGAGGDSSRDAAGSIPTELIILGGEEMRNKVREALGRSPDISFSNIADTGVINIKAKGEKPQEVAANANAYAEAYIALRTDDTKKALARNQVNLQQQIDRLKGQFIGTVPNTQAADQLGATITQLQSNLDNVNALLANEALQVGAKQIETAGVPTSPESPKPLNNALAALGVGLVLGIALAFLRDYLDDTIKTKDDVERASGLTVVGMIPQLTDWKDRAAPRLSARESPTGPTAEAYRTLRTSIQFLGLERTIRTLLVTSPAAGEGKSTTAANLAITFAHAGQRVVLLSSDFRRPRVHTFFGLSNQVGFTSVLLGETPFSEALQIVPDEPYVTVLASGPRPPNPSELLNSRRAAEAISALAGRFDLVLIDSPPVLPVSDSLVIAGLADAILVVARAGQTRKKGLHRSIELLRQVEAPLVGAVLNSADSGNDYGYGSEYHGHETFTQKPRKMKAAPPKTIGGNGEPVNGKRRWLSRSKPEE